MSSRNPSNNTVILVLAVIGALFLAARLLPVVFRMANWALFSVLPLILAIAAVVSCLGSNKPGGVKVLWVLIICLAPIIGPLLWFLWGRNNT